MLCAGNSREAELMQALAHLLNKLNNGGLPVSPEMLEKMKTTNTSIEGSTNVTRNTFHGEEGFSISIIKESILARVSDHVI